MPVGGVIHDQFAVNAQAIKANIRGTFVVSDGQTLRDQNPCAAMGLRTPQPCRTIGPVAIRNGDMCRLILRNQVNNVPILAPHRGRAASG